MPHRTVQSARSAVSWLLLSAVAAGLVACGKDPVPVATPVTTPTSPPAPTAPIEEATPSAAAPETAPAVPDAPTADEGVLSDVWYERQEDGQKSGWTHVVWTAVTVDDAPAIHDRTEVYSSSTRLMSGTRDSFEAHTVVDLDRTPDGALLTQRVVTSQGGRDDVVEQRWTGAGYELTQTVAGATDRRKVACDAPLPVDSETYLGARLRAGELEVGALFSYPSANFLAQRLETVELKVEGVETLALATGPAACWRVKESVKGRPSVGHTWIDMGGVLRKVVNEGSTLVATTEQRARELTRGGVTYSITVHARPNLPRCTNLDRSVVEISFEPRDGMELPDFPVTPFSHELSRKDDTIRVELTAHDPAGATVTLPVASDDMAEWLRPTALLCCDAEPVRKVARSVVGDETDGRKAAKELLAYVFRSLEKRSGPIPSPNALEILNDGCGDCSEHNVLFVTLCRAVGLPARRLSGYAQVGDMWGAHAFCEVWLGQWVGADPTTNELGTRARYVAFGWSDDPDSYPGLVSTRCQGRMRISTVEIQEGDEIVDLTAHRKDDPLRDPLSGIALPAKLPEGWSAAIDHSAGSVSIEGPGVTCEANVLAGMGDLSAALLRRSMLPQGRLEQFGGIESLTMMSRRRGRGAWGMFLVPYKRRLLRMDVRLGSEADESDALARLAEILGPTLR